MKKFLVSILGIFLLFGAALLTGMENEKHPLDDLKNDEINEKREK